MSKEKKPIVTEVIKKGKNAKVDLNQGSQTTLEQVEFKKNELEIARNKYQNTAYEVVGGLDYATKLYDFNYAFAKWAYSDSLGVVEIEGILKSQIEEIKEKKQENLQLPILVVDAVHYFLKKASGEGFESAKNYLDLFVPIGDIMQEAQSEYEKLQTLEFELASMEQSYEQGIAIDNTGNKVEDI